MTKRFGRRVFLARSARAAAGLAIAGIGGEALLSGEAGAVATGKTNGPGRNGIATSRPRRGGSVVYGNDAEVQGFDPTTAEWDENGYMYGRTVFDPLLVPTSTGALAPYLAESFVPDSDYTSWTINLRPNVYFHDGTPCDGAALYTNYEKQASSFLLSAAFAQFVKNVSQVGPLSVRIDATAPWVTFPYYAAGSQVGYVAAPSMLKSSNGTTNPVGTGPFVFKEWVQNDHFTATRNPHYWRKGYPYLDSITYKPIIDANARSEALQSGTIDMMITITPQIIVQYRGKKQWSYVDNSGTVVGEPDVNMIQLNVSQPPFNDPDARLAMAKAYSQAEVVRIFGLNLATPVDSPFLKGTPYYSGTTYPGYDSEGAKRAVKAYKDKTGKPLSFTLSYIPDPEIERTVLYLQQHYQAVGMTVKLSVQEQNTLISNAVDGKYQAVTWRQFGTVMPDLNYVFWSTKTVNPSGISLNIARNYDPRIQSALITGRESPSLATRAKAYQSIGEYLAQDLPYTWLGRTVWAVVADPKVQNFNNPVAPNGKALIGLDNGVTWPTQLWVT